MDRPLKETVYSPDLELLSFGKLLRNMWSDPPRPRVSRLGGKTGEMGYSLAIGQVH